MIWLNRRYDDCWKIFWANENITWGANQTKLLAYLQLYSMFALLNSIKRRFINIETFFCSSSLYVEDKRKINCSIACLVGAEVLANKLNICPALT